MNSYTVLKLANCVQKCFRNKFFLSKLKLNVKISLIVLLNIWSPPRIVSVKFTSFTFSRVCSSDFNLLLKEYRISLNLETGQPHGHGKWPPCLLPLSNCCSGWSPWKKRISSKHVWPVHGYTNIHLSLFQNTWRIWQWTFA